MDPMTPANESTKKKGTGSQHSNDSSESRIGRAAKSPIVFAVQTLLIFTVVIAAVINLSINSHDDPNSKLWISLLSGCVGYILPNPSIKNF